MKRGNSHKLIFTCILLLGLLLLVTFAIPKITTQKCIDDSFQEAFWLLGQTGGLNSENIAVYDKKPTLAVFKEQIASFMDDSVKECTRKDTQTKVELNDYQSSAKVIVGGKEYQTSLDFPFAQLFKEIEQSYDILTAEYVDIEQLADIDATLGFTEDQVIITITNDEVLLNGDKYTFRYAIRGPK